MGNSNIVEAALGDVKKGTKTIKWEYLLLSAEEGGRGGAPSAGGSATCWAQSHARLGYAPLGTSAGADALDCSKYRAAVTEHFLLFC